jgi:hypothetical protein
MIYNVKAKVSWPSFQLATPLEYRLENYEQQRTKTIENPQGHAPLAGVSPRIIDWSEEIRNNFFNECTTETPREESGKKVI